MSNSPLSPDILAMIQTIEGLEHDSDEAATPIRFIVATDWSDAAVPLTLLKAFRTICLPDGPTQLAFAVPHEPSEVDAACIHVLAEGAEGEDDLRGLEVLSFDRASREPYDSAVVPTAESGATIAQVGGLIVRMHDVTRRLEDAGPGGATQLADVLNVGDTVALRHRLAAFSPTE